MEPNRLRYSQYLKIFEGQSYKDIEDIKAGLHGLRKVTDKIFVIDSQRPNAKVPKLVYFRCNRGRKYTSKARLGVHGDKRRKTKSQMSNCSRKIKFVKEHHDGPWHLHEINGEDNWKHNHAIYKGLFTAAERMHVIFAYEDKLKKEMEFRRLSGGFATIFTISKIIGESITLP